MDKFEAASKNNLDKLKTTLLYSLIQAEQIIIEKEYIDTKFDNLTNEEETFKQICKEVINLEIEKNTKRKRTQHKYK